MSQDVSPLHALVMESPIGLLRIESKGVRITGLTFDAAQAPARNTPPVLVEAQRQLAEYFAGQRSSFNLPIAPTGTPFQCAVWEAVAAIPFGATMGYQAIAAQLGGAAAARAIGGANGANPLPIIIPCHRVVGSRGALTGYSGGLARKQWLLLHEGAITPDLFHAR